MGNIRLHSTKYKYKNWKKYEERNDMFSAQRKLSLSPIWLGQMEIYW